MGDNNASQIPSNSEPMEDQTDEGLSQYPPAQSVAAHQQFHRQQLADDVVKLKNKRRAEADKRYNEKKKRTKVEMETKIGELLKVNESLRGENGKLRGENESLCCVNEKLKGENWDLNRENKSLRREKRKLRGENEDLNKEKKILRRGNKILRRENEKLRGDNDCLRHENGSLKQANDSQTKSIDQLTASVHNLTQQLNMVDEVKCQQSEPRRLCLKFVGEVSPTIFTGSKIEAVDGTKIKIVLLDTDKNAVGSGPLPSVKVEIVALDGDFEQEDWTESEFNAKILSERAGRRPLVTGELSLTLKDGAGTLNDVVFTDNSSCVRSRKFRLGARIVQRVSGQVTVREAVSEAFVVKDHPDELFKIQYPLSPDDGVWHLERILEDGALHKRLASQGVFTVKDFLRLNSTDPSALRAILGCGISKRGVEAIIDHASTCVLDDDDELYTYYGITQRAGLLLNSIYKVVAATFEGQNYLPLEKLSFWQKLLVDELKRLAYKNTHEFTMVDRRRAIMGQSLHSEPFNRPDSGLQLDFSAALAMEKLEELWNY